jgi:glutathione S-transferase
LVDQWLDVSACDFEAAVAAIVVAKDGKEVDVTKVSEDVHKFIKVLEAHLYGKKFLVGE